ncbi:hypothetical protein [Chryseobacterium salviniae]|uniref:Uncharacterized protein n=1 Tax=Chryseobacterium salviniae TaxID=3101750 RepID=A0ABU6HXT9_9FLAO|nr:hypothetical protein [Chryseobacterium sp. T9W2-O]MEC3877862.1 hypothetical protein [Chryseobacterium sp. T9W2-O]
MSSNKAAIRAKMKVVISILEIFSYYNFNLTKKDHSPFQLLQTFKFFCIVNSFATFAVKSITEINLTNLIQEKSLAVSSFCKLLNSFLHCQFFYLFCGKKQK